MSPVDGVEDVHLLRHLPQLGHGVAPQGVDVGVDLGAEGGQEVITVHGLGAVARLLVPGLHQSPGLDGRECDGPEPQVAEDDDGEPQGGEQAHGALPAHILTLVCPPRARVLARPPPPGLHLTLLRYQVLGGQDRGREGGVHHPALTVAASPVPGLRTEAGLGLHLPGLQLRPLGQTLLTRAVEARLRGRELGAVGEVTPGVRALDHGGRGRGEAGGRGGVGEPEVPGPAPRTPRPRCDGHEGRGRRILRRNVLFNYFVCEARILNQILIRPSLLYL